MYKVKKIFVRSILNSHGDYAVETEIFFEAGNGRASAPAAILAGRRENAVTHNIRERVAYFNQEVQILIGKEYNQTSWDEELIKKKNEWGTDLLLSLSLAFARGVCACEKMELVTYIRSLGIHLNKNSFSPMIPIFSGGVHDAALGGSMQQIMLTVYNEDFPETVDTILYLYNAIEDMLKKTGRLKGYSSSSGFLVRGIEIDDKFNILAELIQKLGYCQKVSIAIDVAAEHMRKKDAYLFHHKLVSPDAMEDMLVELIRKYPIAYVEDPFDAEDMKNWISLFKKVGSSTKIFSDDLSATKVEYLDNAIVHGVIIKIKQVGTLTATLEMVNESRNKNLLTCVSHRSYETEDTFMCDFGVAMKTDYMKIGGPRRGDRVEKYNQLLRLFEKY